MKRKISLLAQKTWDSYWEDDCMMLGAAVAYYSIFSLAPLLLTVVALAGLVFGRQTVQGRIQEQVQQLIGSGAAEQLDAMLKSAAAQPDQNLFYSIAGIVVILIGATGAFSALQDALNRVWRVKPDPNQGGMRTFVVKRIWSFGMIVGVVFLLIVSLIITAILAAISKWFAGMLPGYISSGLLQVLAAVSSFVIISILFGAIFRVLPDADLKWRDVWVGALLTGVLFTFGKTALGLVSGQGRHRQCLWRRQFTGADRVVDLLRLPDHSAGRGIHPCLDHTRPCCRTHRRRHESSRHQFRAHPVLVGLDIS